MSEKKGYEVNDEALKNVVGGQDDNKKYYIGDVVKFKKVLFNLVGVGPIGITLTGTITAINNGIYTIQAGDSTYYVSENNIKGHKTIKVEGGAAGGWEYDN